MSEQAPATAEAARVKKPRLTGNERRGQIIQAAMHLFSRYGFRGATMRELAREAGISEAMIYHHFPSKEALYDAMLNDRIAEIRYLYHPTEGAGEGQDCLSIETIIENYLRELAKDSSFMRMLLYSALEGHELARKAVDGPLQEFFQLFGSRLEKSMGNRACREMNGPLTARLLCGMAYYAMLLREIYRDPGMQEIAMEDLKNAIVDLLYGAIRVRKPDGDACDE